MGSAVIYIKMSTLSYGIVKICFSIKKMSGIFTAELFRSIDEKAQEQTFSAVFVENAFMTSLNNHSLVYCYII